MKMTNDDCLTMFNGLSVVKQPAFRDLAGMDDKGDYMFHTKFVHRLTKNKQLLEPIIETLRESDKFSDEYKEYMEKRDEILAEHAKKDKTGNPEERIIIGPEGIGQRSFNVPSLTDKTSPVAKAIDKLEKKCKECVDAREKQTEQMKELLKEEARFEPMMIPWAMLPRGLSEIAMAGVIYMIEDEDEDEEDEKPAKSVKKKP